MLKDVICLITALFGFITVFLIGTRYKYNRHTNIYLITIFLLCSFRFLFISLENLALFKLFFLRELELLIFVSISPLTYLYFDNLIHGDNTSKKKEIVHFIVPLALFLIINKSVTDFPNIIVLKIRFLILIAFNLFYIIAVFIRIKGSVWKRNSDIFVISKQNHIIKKWTIIMFSFFVLFFVRFFINLILNKNDFWYQRDNQFLWIIALMWLILYIVILYSPEFLYGYDLFRNKVKEYDKQKIAFDNIWTTESSNSILNVQDELLNKKIVPNIENYILQIEQLAIQSNLFFKLEFKIQDLANKLNLPKSHVIHVFKYHSKISFNDFKKIIRIQRVITLIDEGFLNSNTFDSLALEAGFSSYSSFFKSFKSVTGKSPQDYVIKKRNR